MVTYIKISMKLGLLNSKVCFGALREGVAIFNIFTISPVGIGMGEKMFKKYFLTPRKCYLIFFRINILLYLGVPDNQILLHFSVPDNQILLHFGVPDNQILLHFSVPDNQILLCFGVPNNQILLH